MKRNMDLIRILLLEIEKQDRGRGDKIEVKVEGQAPAVVKEHLHLLIEAGFVSGRSDDVPVGFGRFVFVHRLTWDGHDFLDSVRDPEVWRKTKERASVAGGWGIDLLTDIAKATAREALSKVGLPL